MRTHPMAALHCHDYRYLEEISVHVLSVPILKMSEDGTACRAFWFTPGYVAPTLPNDVYRFIDTPKWMWERYTVDFDTDADGHYKICNFNNLMDTCFQLDLHCWTNKEDRLKSLDQLKNPDPHGPPPNDAAVGVMNPPKLPVEPFENFADLK